MFLHEQTILDSSPMHQCFINVHVAFVDIVDVGFRVLNRRVVCRFGVWFCVHLMCIRC
jgi:hypothetical protein